MAGTAYHYDCKPNTSDSTEYRTLKSKYDGRCFACGGDYSTGDKIAFFPPVKSEPGSNNSALVSRLEGSIKRAFERLSEHHQRLLLLESKVLQQPAPIEAVLTEEELESVF